MGGHPEKLEAPRRGSRATPWEGWASRPRLSGGGKEEGGKEKAVEDAELRKGNFGAEGARERGSGAPRSVGGEGGDDLSPFCLRDATVASENF